MFERHPFDRYKPSFTSPVFPNVSEFYGASTISPRTYHAADRHDIPMSIGKNDVSHSRSSQIYIGLVPCTIPISLRRPHVSTVDFFFMSLFMIDPPEAQESSPPAEGRGIAVLERHYGTCDPKMKSRAVDFERSRQSVIDALGTARQLSIA